MANDIFCMGFIMCLCGNKRARRLVFYFSFFSFLFLNISVCYSNPAIGFGIRAILGRVIAQRSVQAATAELSSSMLARQTALNVSKNLAMGTLPVAPSLLNKGALTWAGIGYSLSALEQADLTRKFNNGQISLVTDGIDLGNGSYQVKLPDGTVRILSFNPTKDNPAIVYSDDSSNSIEDNSSVSSDNSLANNYKYYSETGFNFHSKGQFIRKKYFGNDSTNIVTKMLSENFPLQDDFQTVNKTEFDYFTYPITSFSNFEYEHVSSEKGVKIPDYYSSINPHIVGAYQNIKENFIVTYEVSKIDPSFVACKIGEGNSVSPIFDCKKPSESDYIKTKDTKEIYFNVFLNLEFQPPVNSSVVKSSGTLDDVANKPSLNNINLTPQQLANLINSILMHSASRSDYKGIPFSTSNPVTSSEVDNIMKSHNIPAPSYKDLFKPISSTGGKIDIPNYITDNSSTINIDNSTHNGNSEPNYDNLKPDYPELSHPSAWDILEPFQQFFPEYKNLSIQGKETSCPTWSFSVLNENFTIDSHCGILEKNRSTLYSVFTLIWVLIAFRKLMEA
ncbi:hypothetical protein QJU89_03010 [Pasteurella skyensis]|uniref:Uncharacterized protein n=1 Tax=Phocoenobacter skyensis TaxID=97481 RepID=A0AAJ6P1N0_9PAST|nr:hypothetical protein [Pasteurella skyensis]MDP8163493.1 hypothetical protein [Pasteurella skyensis]MDP8173808.1 hypothetical protein [Pasteurella skyensis]MDP8179957.1 hypothetical protein [Pasteurella skyensis]MDP8182654.1 hypothetical protein [Pasteurella skyensis]MDP8182667.1 hypothetical protein [Pasteurella skyensis]